MRTRLLTSQLSFGVADSNPPHRPGVKNDSYLRFNKRWTLVRGKMLIEDTEFWIARGPVADLKLSNNSVRGSSASMQAFHKDLDWKQLPTKPKHFNLRHYFFAGGG